MALANSQSIMREHGVDGVIRKLPNLGIEEWRMIGSEPQLGIVLMENQPGGWIFWSGQDYYRLGPVRGDKKTPRRSRCGEELKRYPLDEENS